MLVGIGTGETPVLRRHLSGCCYSVSHISEVLRNPVSLRNRVSGQTRSSNGEPLHTKAVMLLICLLAKAGFRRRGVSPCPPRNEGIEMYSANSMRNSFSGAAGTFRAPCAPLVHGLKWQMQPPVPALALAHRHSCRLYRNMPIWQPRQFVSLTEAVKLDRMCRCESDSMRLIVPKRDWSAPR